MIFRASQEFPEKSVSPVTQGRKVTRDSMLRSQRWVFYMIQHLLTWPWSYKGIFSVDSSYTGFEEFELAV